MGLYFITAVRIDETTFVVFRDWKTELENPTPKKVAAEVKKMLGGLRGKGILRLEAVAV